MEIHPYKNRNGQWQATVIFSENAENYEVPAQRRYKARPHNSFRELMEYIVKQTLECDKYSYTAVQDNGEI